MCPATATKTCTKHSFRSMVLVVPSDAASDLLGCLYRDHFPASAPPATADPASAQCHLEGMGRILHSREKRQYSG